MVFKYFPNKFAATILEYVLNVQENDIYQHRARKMILIFCWNGQRKNRMPNFKKDESQPEKLCTFRTNILFYFKEKPDN